MRRSTIHRSRSGLPWQLFVVFDLVTIVLAYAAKAGEPLLCDGFETCPSIEQADPVVAVAPNPVTSGDSANLMWMLPTTGECALAGPGLTDDEGNLVMALDDVFLRGNASKAVNVTETSDYTIFCGQSDSVTLVVTNPPPPPELTACTAPGPSRTMIQLFEQTWTEFFGVPFGAGSSPRDHTMGGGQYITIKELDPDSAVLVSWVSNPNEPFQIRIGVQDCNGAPSRQRALDQPICFIHSGPPGGAFQIGGPSGCQLDPTRRHALVMAYAFPNDSSSCSGQCDWDVRTFGAGSKADRSAACEHLKAVGMVETYPEWCQ